MAKRWADRLRTLGEAGMAGRSSRPHASPGRTPARTERRILGLRVTRRWGPARIAFHLRLAVSTVGRVLRRYGAPPLRFTDPATGHPHPDQPAGAGPLRARRGRRAGAHGRQEARPDPRRWRAPGARPRRRPTDQEVRHPRLRVSAPRAG